MRSFFLTQLMTVVFMNNNLTDSLPAEEIDRKAALPVSRELGERCVSILKQGLRSDEFWPAMHAAEGLTMAGGGAEVIKVLSNRLPVEKDDQKRCGLARELARAGERVHIELLLEILSTPDSKGRTHAAESLFKVSTPRETGDGASLRSAMQQADSIPLQIMAAGALAKSGDPKAVPFLREKFQSDDTTARNLSAWVLGRLGDQSDVAPILAALKSETDDASKGFLAVSLACLGNADGRMELIEQMNSPTVTARAMAAEFAGISRTVEAREKLIQLLDDPAADVQIRAAQSLLMLSKAAMPAEK
jgi:sialidase-1